MTITGSNTTNFGFQKLGSNDSAGYSTINEVVDGIDTILNVSDRLIKAGQTPTTSYVITGDGVDWIAGLVVTNSITDLNVTTAKIAANAVTGAKIESSVALPGAPTVVTANGSYQQSSSTSRVATIQYVNDAAASLTAGTAYVVGGDLSGTTGAATIVTNAVTQTKMADNSVGTAEIIDSNVTYAKLGDDVKYYQTAVVVTTSGASARTFSLTDSNRKFIEYNVTTTGGTFTVPPSGTTNFPIGAEIHLLQTNTGQLTIAAGVGVTINATPGLKLRTQWSSATLIKRASDTWILVGDLVA